MNSRIIHLLLLTILLLPLHVGAWTGTVHEDGLIYTVYITGTKYEAVADSASCGSPQDFSGFADVQSQISYKYSWSEFVGYDEDGDPIYETHTRTLTAPVTSLEIHSAEVTGVNIPGTVTSFSLRGCTGLTSVAIPGSVTYFRPYAFSGCTGLKEIDIPNSVEYIGLGAFTNCNGLESIELPVSIRSIDTRCGNINRDATFSGCTGLKSVKIFCSPDLGYGNPGIVFYGCSNLERVEFHCQTIRSGWGFNNSDEYTPKLREIIIGNEVEVIGGLRYLTNVTSLYIPSSVKSILPYSCPPNLTRVDISDLAAYIRIDGDHPGSGPNRHLYLNGHVITDLIIPVDTVPVSCFSYDQDLKTVDTGGAEVIDYEAFAFCPNLETLIPGNALTTLVGYSFRSCPKLKTVTIPENVASIAQPYFNWYDFEDNIYECGINPAFYDNSIENLTWNAVDCEFYMYGYDDSSLPSDSIKVLTIGDKVKKIPYGFLRGAQITSLTIPPSVMSIGPSAFICPKLKTINWNAQNCTACTTVKRLSMDESLTEFYEDFGYSMPFRGCDSLTRIKIGDGVQSIVGDMFNISYGYNNIDTVECHAIVPPAISEDCFARQTYNNAVLCVPRESLEAYRNAEGWENFFKCSAIEDIPGDEDKVRGDVDGDGQVNISDVTALIDYLLSGNASSVNVTNADCDGDGLVNIADVTALIDYLLTGTW